MKGKKKEESFSFDIFINWKKTDIFGLISINKYLKLGKKLIKFVVLIGILLIVIMSLILNCHFL